MIRLICPGCEKVLKVNETLAGRTVACPSCKSPFQVPAAEETPDEVPAEKPPRRRPADEDDETPPPKLRPVDDEDDEDRPRKRRRDDDEDEDEDEEDRPRPRIKKKKKRKRVSSGGGGGFSEWGTVSKVLSVSTAICAVFILLGLVWMPFIIGAFVVSCILMFVGGIGLLVVAFQDDMIQGLLCLFVPFYGLIYLITHFEECKSPFLILVGGIVLEVISGCAGGGIAAMKGDVRLGFPQAQPWVAPALSPTLRT